MKRLLAIFVLVLLTPSQAMALTYPPDLAATLSIATRTTSTVTVQVTQTSGQPISIEVFHTCYAGSIYAGGEKKSVLSNGLLTFNIGPRKFHGTLLLPTACQADGHYVIDGNTWLSLGEGSIIQTLP